jgi:hypothetical protein
MVFRRGNDAARTGLIYAFSAPASSMSPASMAGLIRDFTGDQ